MTKCSQKCLAKGEGTIIIGKSKDRGIMRHRNWACRLADQIADHDPGKQVATRYRPCLIPTLYDGIPSLRMSKSLQQCEEHKHMYEVVMDFAQYNGLEIVESI